MESSPSLSSSDSSQRVRSSAILSGTEATLATLSDTEFAGEVSRGRGGNGVPICLMAAALTFGFCCKGFALTEQLLIEDAREDLVLAETGKRFTAGGSVLDENRALGGVVFVCLRCPIFSKRLALDLGDSQAQKGVSRVCWQSQFSCGDAWCGFVPLPQADGWWWMVSCILYRLRSKPRRY